MFSTEFSEFNDIIFMTLKGLKPATSCVRDQHATTIEPNSCFSDLSVSLNSPKALLHLGKTPLPRHHNESVK